MSYIKDIIKKTTENSNFRKVLLTGSLSQIVVMDIPPSKEIGIETHKNTEQILVIVKGSGKSILDGIEKEIEAGDVVVVQPGVTHNFVNTGTVSLKLYTVYTPPNHIDGRVHETKEAADKDIEDEDFGNKTN